MAKALRACLFAALVPTLAAAEPVIYRIDPQHTFVTFEVLHFGTSTVRGRFGGIEGQVELDRASGSGFAVLRIPTATVDTGVPAFDARLREPDLLATEEHPEARFVAQRFRFDGAQLKSLSGELRLRDVRQVLELRALRFGCHTHPQLQREVCGGDFEGEIERASFGASFGMPFVANRVRLKVQVEGLRE